MAKYPIPQFIEQEGKIIFFLSYRQFFILVGGGATCIIIYFLLPLTFFLIGSAVVMGLAAVIAFVKINDAPIITVLLHFIGFSMAAKTYTWKKKETPYPYKIQKTPDSSAMQPSRLQEIQKIVETKK